MPILRLVLCVVVAGCAAASFERVPDADWQSVPPRERAAMDGANDAELAHAQADIRAATASLAEAQKMLASQHKQVVQPLPAYADQWFKDREPLRKDAAVRADMTREAWLRANVEWRQHRLEAVTARIEVIKAEREVARAKAIDHHLLGDDTYDGAMYRGQLARLQDPWYRAELRADTTRGELEHLGAKMASAQEAYAQMMRMVAPEDNEGRLKLSGWTVAVPRHGLKFVASSPVNARPGPRYLVLRR